MEVSPMPAGWLVVVLLAALLATGGVVSSAPARQELVIANEADLTVLDPIRIQEAPTSFVASFVYEQLVKRTHEGKIAPSLAESWKLSPDRRTWTFQLRKGVKFHDGSDFDASVVEWHFRRVLDPKEGSGFRRQFMVIEKITVLDRYTIAFTLTEPNVAFLEFVMLTNGAFIPSRQAYETLGAEFPFKAVGTGPFKWGQWVQGQRVVLERNPSWWGTPPKLERLIIRPILDPNTGVIELETGGVHYLMRASREDINRLSRDQRFVVYRVPTYRARFIEMNVTRPPFDDPKVRQAVNHALNVPEIINALASGMAVPVDTILPVESPFHPKKGTYTTYPYDPQKARTLLAEAGWRPGPGGVLRKGDQPLRVTLHSPNGRYFADKEISEVICNRLQAIGMECRVKVMDWAAFLDEVRAGKFEATFLGWNQSSGEPSLFFDPLVATGGRGNYAKYSDPQLDQILKEGLIAFSEGRRKLLYARAVDIINRHAWYVPLSNEFKIAIATSRMQGYVHSAALTDLVPVWLK
jgi:peptide/nickel transport system substrate-binding protein